jgi:serine protease inhibitor
LDHSDLNHFTIFVFLTEPKSGFAAANDKFMVKLYSEIAKDTSKDSNLILSPFTVSSVLAMIRVGAKGRTAAQVKTALALPDDHQESMQGKLFK